MRDWEVHVHNPFMNYAADHFNADPGFRHAGMARSIFLTDHSMHQHRQSCLGVCGSCCPFGLGKSCDCNVRAYWHGLWCGGLVGVGRLWRWRSGMRRRQRSRWRFFIPCNRCGWPPPSWSFQFVPCRGCSGALGTACLPLRLGGFSVELGWRCELINIFSGSSPSVSNPVALASFPWRFNP